jgi:hypothetical protein
VNCARVHKNVGQHCLIPSAGSLTKEKSPLLNEVPPRLWEFWFPFVVENEIKYFSMIA